MFDFIGKSDQQFLTLSKFTIDNAVVVLKSLSNKTFIGPDATPPHTIRDCAPILAKPLLHLFNLILQSSVFPST